MFEFICIYGIDKELTIYLFIYTQIHTLTILNVIPISIHIKILLRRKRIDKGTQYFAKGHVPLTKML